MLERTRENKKTGHRTMEQQYYISSLNEDAQHLAKIIRHHWGVENKVHWVLDVVYREDDCRIRKEDGAENVGLIRRFYLNLTKLHSRKASVKAKLRKSGWSDEFREEILFGEKVS